MIHCYKVFGCSRITFLYIAPLFFQLNEVISCFVTFRFSFWKFFCFIYRLLLIRLENLPLFICGFWFTYVLINSLRLILSANNGSNFSSKFRCFWGDVGGERFEFIVLTAYIYLFEREFCCLLDFIIMSESLTISFVTSKIEIKVLQVVYGSCTSCTAWIIEFRTSKKTVVSE